MTTFCTFLHFLEESARIKASNKRYVPAQRVMLH